MAVSLIITNREHFSKIKNGNDYTLNSSDTFTHLKGNVIESQKIEFTLELTWSDVSTSSNRWFIENGNTLRRTSGSWIAEGFSIGDTIDYNDTPATPVVIFANRVITNISDEIIIFDGAALSTGGYSDSQLLGGKTDVNGLEYSFGIIPQDDSPSFTSLLDGSDQTYYMDNIQSGVIAGTPKGSIKSWVTGNSSAEFISRPSTYVQEFKVTHEFVINPYYTEDQKANFESNTTPSLLLGNNTLKYVSKFEFRTNLSNPNTAKIYEDDIQLGSVGWFDESFNGYNSNHTISNLVYEDIVTTQNTSGLNVSSNTRVTFTIDSTNAIFTAASPIIAYHSYLPSFNNYDSKEDLFTDVWFNEDLYNTIDGGTVDGNLIKDFIVTRITDNQINVSFEVHYTSAQREAIEEGFNYLLGIGIADSTLLNDNDLDKTILLIDFNEYLKENNIQGLLESVENVFIPYYDFGNTVDNRFTDIKDWNQGLFLNSQTIQIDRGSTKDAQINSLRFKLVAFNDTDSTYFELQNEQFDLSNGVTLPVGNVDNTNPNEIIYYDLDLRRNYNLADGDEFNFFRLQTLDSVGDFQKYEIEVGFFLNWQEWIALPNADTIFFDNSEPLNNLNNKTSNYSLKNGYSIRVILEAEMQGLDEFGSVGNTTYNVISPAFDILDFDQQDNTPTTWSCELKTLDENYIELDGNNLGTTEVTKIQAIFTDLVRADVGDINDYWAAILIEEQNQLGFDASIVSTNKIPQSDNINRLDGNTIYATLTKTSPTIITAEVNTIPSNLKDGIAYNLYGVLRSLVDAPTILSWVFRTENNIATQTFDPSVSTIGGEVVTWSLIAGSSYNVNNLSIPSGTSLGAGELDGTCQDVTVTFSTNDATNIESITIINDVICEALDLSLFTNCESFKFSNNNITSVTNPTSSKVITDYDLSNNDMVVLDMSTFSNLGGRFLSKNSGNLTTLTFAPSTQVFTRFDSLSCDLTGTLDLSMLTSLGGDFNIRNNPNLTTLLTPSSTEVFTRFWAYDCDLTGVLDLSNLTNLGGTLICSDNPNLTSITNPTSSVTFSNYAAINCNISTIDFSNLTDIIGTNGADVLLQNNVLPVVEVDKILLDIDNNSIGGFTGRTVNLSGQTPAAPPTGGGGNANVLSLISKGVNVITD